MWTVIPEWGWAVFVIGLFIAAVAGLISAIVTLVKGGDDD